VKGIIFNLVEDTVRTEHGADVWDEVVDESGVTGAYTSLGTYPDEDLVALASTVADRLGTDASSVVRHVGHRSIATLSERYPEFFEPYDELRPFLLTLNSVIHAEVRKLYPGAIVPDFDYITDDPEVLGLVYRSHRGRCDLAEGLILGAADHFGEQVELSQPECTQRGDARCLLLVRSR
jgi:predicted hydrocarbon binding protein